MERMKLIGIGADGTDSLPSLYEQWIHESERLVGGERHLSFSALQRGKNRHSKQLIIAFSHTCKRAEKTVILASGDPLFYGIGSYLAKKFRLKYTPLLVRSNGRLRKWGKAGTMHMSLVCMDVR